jgi:hypothetical protein
VTKSSKTRDSRRRSTKSSRSGTKSSPPTKRKPQEVAAAPTATSPGADQRTCDDEAAYVESLITSGQAARLDKDGKLPAGATHKIVEDESGNVKVVRRRFSIT